MIVIRWDSESLENLPEAVRRAVLKTGMERIRVETVEAGPWKPQPGFQSFLVHRTARLKLVRRGTEKPYLSFPEGGGLARRIAADRCPVVRFRLCLERGAEVRGVSHLEQTRIFRRALRRSGLDLALTQTRRPRFRLAFGPAVSVGHESRAEYLDVALCRRVEARDVRRELDSTFPPGYRVLEVRKIPLHYPSVEFLVSAAWFEIQGPVPPPRKGLGDRSLGGSVLKWETGAGRLRILLRVRRSSPVGAVPQRGTAGEVVRPEEVLERSLGGGRWMSEVTIRREQLLMETSEGKLVQI